MLNYLENLLKRKFCDTYDQCALKDVCKANEKLHKEIKHLKDKEENSPLICKYINENNQTLYINLSYNKNGIIYARQTMLGNKVRYVDFYGHFNINFIRKKGDFQIVSTAFKYDKHDISYCYITDFKCYGNNGYGTIMMECILNYLKSYQVSYILGWASPVDTQDPNDNEHGSRLHHFYEKFGFYFFWEGKEEYLRLDLKDKKYCSKEYLEHTYYEIAVTAIL